MYPFAAYLGRMYGLSHAIAVGRPTAKDLLQLYPRFEIIGVVPDAELEFYRDQFRFATWLGADLNRPGAIPLPDDVLKRAVVVCAGVVERLASPAHLLENLKTWLDHAPLCLLTSADAGSNRGGGKASPAAATHSGRRHPSDLERLLRDAGFKLEFVGLTASDNVAYEKKTALAVVANNAAPDPHGVRAPPDFRVVAFMAAYNEEDIIVHSIRKWTDQGVRVHVLENWSTDATYDLVKQMEGRLPVTVERFPVEGPSPYFDWGAMLERIEELSGEIEADWFVRRGADEVLASPWPGLSYRDGLYLADRAGFNCVDHTIIEFHPVDEGFEPGTDHEAYFRHFDFKHLSHRWQRKAWKNCGRPISTTRTAGHDVLFEGRRVYPYKFLLKHYAVRSQKHGEKKVFRERKARWNPKERAKGWHIHYDSIQEGHQFLQAASEKEFFEEEHFHQTYLVERLSGIGTERRKL